MPRGYMREHFPQWRKHIMLWLAAPIVLISLTLTPLAVFQYKQYQSLIQQPQYGNDSVIMLAYQMEREALRFALALQDYLSAEYTTNTDVLMTRFDLFYSRVGLLEQNPGARWIKNSNDYVDGLQAVNTLIDKAVPIFESSNTLKAATRQQLADIQTDTAGLTLKLARLTFTANSAVYANFDKSNTLLREQSMLIIVVTIAQGVLMAIAIVATFLYIRRHQRQVAQLTELTQALELARDKAESANRSKSIFLANMSHEIRTPFQGLLGMINLLLQTRLNARQKDYVNTAHTSAQHLLGVVNDVLDMSTIESGNLHLNNGPVDLHALVKEVGHLMRTQATAKGLELTVTVAHNTPQWLHADSVRLRQVMYNLLSNAIKFTQQGKVQFEVCPNSANEPGIQIGVVDTGIGMSQQTIDMLFTRFFQADDVSTKRYQGTGLGLEISRTLIQLMNGTLHVSSVEGKGSRFQAVLPLGNATPIEVNAVVDADSLYAMATDGKSLRVLVTEDHPINMKVLSILLERMGHEATLCSSGACAIDALKKDVFDVVLMDYHMPDMDGLETTRLIRELPNPAGQIPIVLITADVVEDTRVRALAAGITAFAPKPVRLQDLHATFTACDLLATPDTAGRTTPDHNTPHTTSEYSPVDYSYHDTPLLNISIFSELCDLFPADNWATMTSTLFDPPHGDVPVLVALLEGHTASKALGEQAHKVKGAAMMIGLQRLGELCAHIEEQCNADAQSLQFDAALLALSATSHDTQQALAEQLRTNNTAHDA